MKLDRWLIFTRFPHRGDKAFLLDSPLPSLPSANALRSVHQKRSIACWIWWHEINYCTVSWAKFHKPQNSKNTASSILEAFLVNGKKKIWKMLRDILPLILKQYIPLCEWDSMYQSTSGQVIIHVVLVSHLLIYSFTAYQTILSHT